jgi:hypothetical protein
MATIDRASKTFFPGTPDRRRIHSPERVPFNQDSLIFVCCIDFSRTMARFHYPVVSQPDRGI